VAFKDNVRDASADVVQRLDCVEVRTWRLYTPYWKSGTYKWMSPMDTDGLLVHEREASGGPTGAKPPIGVKVPPLLIGVVVQVEEATGHTKPNPFGKASVVNVPLGLWIDRAEYDAMGTFVRHARARLDHAWVLFVTRDNLVGVRRNLGVVTTTNRDSWTLAFDQNATANVIANGIERDVRGFLKGRGRPKRL